MSAAPVIFLLIWSGGFIALETGLAYTGPLMLLSVRYICVLVLLVLPILIFRPPFPGSFNEWSALVGVGLFLHAGYFIFTCMAISAGLSSGIVALIVNQQPVLLALISPVIAGEKIKPVQYVGFVLGSTGSSIVILDNMSAGILSLKGLIFALLALFSFTVSTLIEKKSGYSAHPLTSNFIQCATGLLVAVPLALVMEPFDIRFSWPLAGSLAYLVLGATLLAITLMLKMIRTGQAAGVSALFFLVPPLTTILAVIIFKEQVSEVALSGIMIAAAGTFMAVKLKK